MNMNLKKHLLALIAFVLFFSSLQAQEGAHEKGKHYIGPGFGVYPLAIGVSARYDYAIHKNWSIGGMFGFNGESAPRVFSDYLSGELLFSFRGSFHLGKFVKLPESFDWYTGITAGLNVFYDNTNFITGEHLNGHVGVHTGLRYFLPTCQKLGLQLDLTAGYEIRSVVGSVVWRLGSAKEGKKSKEQKS